jgi:hypothetical protein
MNYKSRAMQSQALDIAQSIVYDLSVNDVAVSNQGMIEQHLAVNCLGRFKVTRVLSIADAFESHHCQPHVSGFDRRRRPEPAEGDTIASAQLVCRSC